MRTKKINSNPIDDYEHFLMFFLLVFFISFEKLFCLNKPDSGYQGTYIYTQAKGSLSVQQYIIIHYIRLKIFLFNTKDILSHLFSYNFIENKNFAKKKR